jgi:hypothetical protein
LAKFPKITLYWYAKKLAKKRLRNLKAGVLEKLAKPQKITLLVSKISKKRLINLKAGAGHDGVFSLKCWIRIRNQ